MCGSTRKPLENRIVALEAEIEEAEDRAVHWHKQHGILHAENKRLRTGVERDSIVIALRAENAKLREALEKISQQNPAPDPYGSGLVARAALKLSDAK